jgi:hypothetical protein
VINAVATSGLRFLIRDASLSPFFPIVWRDNTSQIRFGSWITPTLYDVTTAHDNHADVTILPISFVVFLVQGICMQYMAAFLSVTPHSTKGFRYDDCACPADYD